MSKPDEPTKPDDDGSTVEEYVLGVRIVDRGRSDATEPRYRFEAPDHVGVEFEDADLAELYADVYFDVNGFVEEDTGDRGVPPEVVQSGKDTLAAYLLTRPWTTVDWIASFYGTKPDEIERYVSLVRQRAEKIRARARERTVETARE